MDIIERMKLNDHQKKHNINHSQRKNGIMELNTNDDIMEQNKSLTQIMDEMEKLLSKLPQQVNEMHESPQQRNITFCKLSNGDHTTEFPSN